MKIPVSSLICFVGNPVDKYTTFMMICMYEHALDCDIYRGSALYVPTMCTTGMGIRGMCNNDLRNPNESSASAS